MASIKKVTGKNGVAYKITVYEGRTSNGKQIRHYTTYTPPPGMREVRAEKEAVRVAAQFEEKLNQGYQVDNHISFEEYSVQFLESKQRAGLKKSTYDRYVLLLRRINPAIGHMRLQDIRPRHLNQFYDNLLEPDIRFQPQTALPRTNISHILKQRKISQERLAKTAKISLSTVRKALRGNSILWDKAISIAATLGIAVEDLFDKQHNAEPLSSKSVLEHHRLIRSILGQAEKELLVPYNAASKATPPKSRRVEVNIFQPNEISEILNALETEPLKWQCIIHLMIVTGCRRGEIMGLKWERVALDTCIIHICETLLASDTGAYADTPKTPESQRYIKIPKETALLLTHYKSEQDRIQSGLGNLWQNTGYVFTGNTGLPMHPDSVNGWLNKFSERHNLRHINPHAFRHSMASILINSGTDILSVSRRLGHAKASTTLNFYGHMIQQADVQSSNCIADVLLRKNSNNVAESKGLCAENAPND